MITAMLVSNNELIESIVVQGRTEQLYLLYDRYITRIRETAEDWAEDEEEATIISYYAMIRSLLGVASHEWKIPFGISVYANVYNTWIDWNAAKRQQLICVKKTSALVEQLKDAGQMRSLVFENIEFTFAKQLASLFSIRRYDFNLSQAGPFNRQDLIFNLDIDDQRANFILMNVWAGIAEQYNQEYKESFEQLLFSGANRKQIAVPSATVIRDLVSQPSLSRLN